MDSRWNTHHPGGKAHGTGRVSSHAQHHMGCKSPDDPQGLQKAPGKLEGDQSSFEQASPFHPFNGNGGLTKPRFLQHLGFHLAFARHKKNLRPFEPPAYLLGHSHPGKEMAPCATPRHQNPNLLCRLLLQGLYLLEEMFRRTPTPTRLMTSEDPP
jgi:hypothetical protein